MGLIISMSICTYNSGDFDVMFRDKETGEEIIFSGNMPLGSAQIELVNRIAPACVWTDFEKTTKD